MRPQNKYLKPFPKGVSGNPSGKPKALLTKADIEVLFQKFAKKTKSELQEVINNPKSTMVEIMVASVMAKAAIDGDYQRLSFLLDRAVGKVADVSVNQNINANLDKQDLIDRVPVETVIELVKALPEPENK